MNLIAEIQKLQNYLKVQDYKTVVDGCEKLINKFPHNPFLFNLQGLALHGSGKYLIAIDRYKKALDLDKNFLPALFLGDSLYDIQTAKKYDLDFIFIYGWTDLNGWKEICHENKLTYVEKIADLI